MPQEKALTLVFLIDALGYEQAGDPAFLPLLARKRAPVRSVLGYSSAALPTLLSGLLPAQHGHFAMYRRAAGDGVFAPLSGILPTIARRTHRHWFLRRWVTRYLRWRGVTGYFALYEIPLEWLPLFDLCQRRDIFAPRAFDGVGGGVNGGVSGLADLVGQPPTGRLWNWSVPEEQAFRELESEIDLGQKRFLLLYTAGLDALMHAVGPENQSVRTKLREYEERISKLLILAETRYRSVSVFVFGDHGMAEVRGTHDLWSQIENLGLKVPAELLFFLDSTMARFWFGSQSARQKVLDLLAGQDYGRLLTEAELTTLGAHFPHREYGEAIYLLREGEILVPSFMSRGPVRGMHGYHPDERASFTTLLTNREDVSYPRDLQELHALVRASALEPVA